MDKIEELKKLLWILDSKHNVSIPQTKENIDYIAQEIVKLFCQPAVISSVCECKVCGKPFDDKLSLYEHYDEEHNKQTDC